jgi:hypothetical protein
MKHESKLRRWAVVMPMFFALLIFSFTVEGCKAATVAQDIINWTPALQAGVQTIDSTAAMLAPAEAPIFILATAGFDTASNLLVAQARAYLANPTASVLQQLQAAVVAFQQQINASLLASAKITNPASQALVMNAINGVATVVLAILALVSSISSKVAVAQMARDSTIKLAQVEPYLDTNAAAWTVAAHYKGNQDISAALSDGSFGAGSLAVSGGLMQLQSEGF